MPFRASVAVAHFWHMPATSAAHRRVAAEDEMRLGAGEILIVLLVVLLVFGPNKLPQLGDALGKGIRNFKRASTVDEPTPAAPVEERAALPGAAAPAPAAQARAVTARGSTDGD